jgi:hypothetical protein
MFFLRPMSHLNGSKGLSNQVSGWGDLHLIDIAPQHPMLEPGARRGNPLHHLRGHL